MKLYSGKGDGGNTGILGKDRLSKDDVRIEAYGTVDELNATVGMLIHHVEEVLHPSLRQIQSVLFEIGSELASVQPRQKLMKNDVTDLESLIDTATDETTELKSFILPGGSIGASWLHIARTVARRAERRVVTLSHQVQLNQYIIPYLNRLSDLFFAWARLQNHIKGVEDIAWEARS